MRRSVGYWWALNVGMLLALAAGCEPGADHLAPVCGKLSYQGKPLRTGTIVFTPDALRGTRGSMARADIQPDGTYSLRSNGMPGAAVGWHRVTVMATESVPVTVASGGVEADVMMPRSLLPERYRDPELSGLSRQVRPGQEN